MIVGFSWGGWVTGGTVRRNGGDHGPRRGRHAPGPDLCPPSWPGSGQSREARGAAVRLPLVPEFAGGNPDSRQRTRPLQSVEPSNVACIGLPDLAHHRLRLARVARAWGRSPPPRSRSRLSTCSRSCPVAYAVCGGRRSRRCRRRARPRTPNRSVTSRSAGPRVRAADPGRVHADAGDSAANDPAGRGAASRRTYHRVRGFDRLGQLVPR